MMTSERILLIGLMGAGKTTIGNALSARLGWPYRDNDALVFQVTGKTARQLQQAGDIPALRRAESTALATALATPAPLIASVAAGVVTQPSDFDKLRTCDAFVVWLRTDIEVLAKRVAGTDRPWVADDPIEALRLLDVGRERLYAAAADLVVDVANTITPDSIAQKIIAAMTAPAS